MFFGASIHYLRDADHATTRQDVRVIRSKGHSEIPYIQFKLTTALKFDLLEHACLKSVFEAK